MAFNENVLINEVALHERGISGVRDSFAFAKNPDNVTAALLPCVLHYSSGFESELRAHHNQWKNTITVKSILLVAPRETAGGKLRYLENAAIPYGHLWRAKFQDATVLSSLYSVTSSVKIWLARGDYGVGGELLSVGTIDFIGWVFTVIAISA